MKNNTKYLTILKLQREVENSACFEKTKMTTMWMHGKLLSCTTREGKKENRDGLGRIHTCGPFPSMLIKVQVILLSRSILLFLQLIYFKKFQLYSFLLHSFFFFSYTLQISKL